MPAPGAGDIRLVVTDMDGTLLDADGAVPASFWPVLERMRAASVTFVPASGRQYATLARDFAGEGLAIIAENGGLVMRDGVEVASRTLDAGSARGIIGQIRALPPEEYDLGIVLCGKSSAYIERIEPVFVDQANTYYAQLSEVPDLLAVEDEILKIAVFDLKRHAQRVAPALEAIAPGNRVVVSGPQWVDIMRPDVNKGLALDDLQAALGVTPAQTVVFGDYLNDLEMMSRAEHSYAMANAHPDILAAARHWAPSNAENGVVSTLERLLG
ncbi:Cof-type HAD-IIB family hydrolase [Zhihengliuella salsuginis]|uniref:Haloacid dehalogenase n=1 Tax=Zhihengliuella salsuginis TaxID=578222 RepID=A0ABQ3GKD5_9MICC|nr:Cof-type HAD-IIB family hydrolase [Zhihengliuella salsuginis]GHD12329.1 haloacid dehalogenase [Zhihengliuella salsuginis]